MSKFMKGNYRLAKGKAEVKGRAAKPKDLTAQFEESALAKLGGSLCFVMKKGTFVWSGDEAKTPSRGASA